MRTPLSQRNAGLPLGGLLLLLAASNSCLEPTVPSDTEPQIQMGTASANNVELYYEIAGEGSAVILLPGGALDTRLWDAVFLSLARSHRVVRYDPRGFGRSGSVQEAFEAHEDLDGLLRYLEIDRASLVGLSYGGRVAIDYTLQHPDKVQALILVGSGLGGFDWSQADFSWSAEIDRALKRGDLEAVAETWLASPYMAPAMEIEELAATLRQIAIDTAPRWAEPGLEVPLEPPAIERLSNITTPTLVVVGTRDVPEILEIAEILQSRIRGVERVDFEGAGHIIPLERPEPFLNTVEGFLRRHAPGGR